MSVRWEEGSLLPDEGSVLRSDEDEKANANKLCGRQQHVLVLATQLALQVRTPLSLVLGTATTGACKNNNGHVTCVTS